VVRQLKLQKLGRSLGVVLPQAALARLAATDEDFITLTMAPDGGRLTRANREFTRSMATFASLDRRYRNALRDLAQ
jgi:antitoxin component of MazEF toxin-antitoxin module